MSSAGLVQGVQAQVSDHCEKSCALFRRRDAAQWTGPTRRPTRGALPSRQAGYRQDWEKRAHLQNTSRLLIIITFIKTIPDYLLQIYTIYLF